MSPSTHTRFYSRLFAVGCWSVCVGGLAVYLVGRAEGALVAVAALTYLLGVGLVARDPLAGATARRDTATRRSARVDAGRADIGRPDERPEPAPTDGGEAEDELRFPLDE